jgi:hypothetical protein
LGASDVLWTVVDEGSMGRVQVVETAEVGEGGRMGFAQSEFVAEVDGFEVGSEEVPIARCFKLGDESLSVEGVRVAEEEKAKVLGQVWEEGEGPRL